VVIDFAVIDFAVIDFVVIDFARGAVLAVGCACGAALDRTAALAQRQDLALTGACSHR
jgi:hypothetical protein